MLEPKRPIDARLLDRVATIILAGGQGTRLAPLTNTRCKPSVSFAGKYRLIDVPMSNSLNAKIRRIYVLSQYFANELGGHITDTYHSDLFQGGGVEMLTPETRQDGKISLYKGTAAAVRVNLEKILSSGAEYFIILSGDQLYRMDLGDFVSEAARKKAGLLIATQPIPEEEAPRMGLLKIGENGKIIDFVEKPKDPKIMAAYKLSPEYLKGHQIAHPEKPQYMGSMGIYVFSRECLQELLQEEGDDFGKDLIPKQMAKGNVYSYLHTGYWEDIGTIASYYNANLALIGKRAKLDMYDQEKPIFTSTHHLPSPMITNTIIKGSLIGQGAIVSGKEVSGSILGIRAYIDEGAVIKDSLILGHHTLSVHNTELEHYHPHKVGKHSVLEKVIIDEGGSVGNHVSLTNKDKLTHYDGTGDGRGIYIRDGIIIVESGKHVPDGFVL